MTPASQQQQQQRQQQPPLPPADRDRSPRTGWTRAHWEAVADRMLEALVPYASPGFAQYRLPGRNSWSGVESDALEGFARSFLLAAFRIAGAGGAVDPRLIERYAAGLDAGTDPRSGEAWPEITDRSQPMVEAASIAIALHETRPWIWDRLDPAVQERVVGWFSGFVGRETWDCNWRLFQVVSEQFLASVGAPYSQRDIDGGLGRIEDWYLGGGWYSDGDGKNFDYYIGWAMHLYPLLWARIAGEGNDGGRAAVYRERLSQFLAGYQHFFGADGAPVHQGRSLTYRFAAAAPVWMGALADATPLDPGLTRRLASGVLRHFHDRGVPDGRGLLSLGWYGPFPPVTQAYSGPASPYWASKGFLGLLLPEEHPVWTARERPLPVEEADQYVALPQPGWLLHSTRSDGIVRLLNHGSDHNEPQPWSSKDDPHYAKLAYSTRTAPESAPPAWERCVDSHIALVSPDGTASRRTFIHPVAVDGRSAASWHTARLPGDDTEYRVATTAVPHGPWEIRVHRIEAPAGAPAGMTVREGGYAVAGEEPPHTETGEGWALARRRSETHGTDGTDGMDGMDGTGGTASAVVGLYGWDTAGVTHDSGANAFGPHSAAPYLTSAPHPGGSSVHVTLVALSGAPLDPRALREAVTVVLTGDDVLVRLPDGTEVRA